MCDAITIAFFVSLFSLAATWLLLVAWCFHRLRVQHAATYEAIGSPSLFRNNSMRNNWLFMKFLYEGQWQSLDDAALAAVARLMQVLFVVYMLGFIGLLAIFFIC